MLDRIDSVLNYIGKKSPRLIKEYGFNIENYDTYCEPFSGSFNAGLNVREKISIGKRVIFNDLDWEVYNFWSCVKENPDKVYSEIIKLYTSEIVDDNTYKILSDKIQDKYERAALEFIYRNNLSMNGLVIRPISNTLEVDMFTQSMIMQNVELYNMDFADIIAKINTDTTFIFVDPPYLIENVSKYYRVDTEKFSHVALLNALINFKGDWLLSYNNCDIIKDLYRSFDIKERNINAYKNELFICKRSN